MKPVFFNFVSTMFRYKNGSNFRNVGLDIELLKIICCFSRTNYHTVKVRGQNPYSQSNQRVKQEL